MRCVDRYNDENKDEEAKASASLKFLLSNLENSNEDGLCILIRETRALVMEV